MKSALEIVVIVLGFVVGFSVITTVINYIITQKFSYVLYGVGVVAFVIAVLLIVMVNSPIFCKLKIKA